MICNTMYMEIICQIADFLYTPLAKEWPTYADFFYIPLEKGWPTFADFVYTPLAKGQPMYADFLYTSFRNRGVDFLNTPFFKGAANVCGLFKWPF